MNTPMVLLMLQLAMALMLCWSCFCRVTRTNADTRREVRWAMVFEGACAGLVFGAPFLPLLMPNDFHWQPGATPHVFWVVLLLSIVAVQLVTAKYWAAGVPGQFQEGVGVDSRAFDARSLAVVAVMLAGVALLAPPDATAAGEPAAPPAAAAPRLGPVLYVRLGEVAMCGHPDGCVSMVMPAYRSLSLAAQSGATCQQQRGGRSL